MSQVLEIASCTNCAAFYQAGKGIPTEHGNFCSIDCVNDYFYKKEQESDTGDVYDTMSVQCDADDCDKCPFGDTGNCRCRCHECEGCECWKLHCECDKPEPIEFTILKKVLDGNPT